MGVLIVNDDNEQLSPNRSMDRAIKDMLPHFSDRSQQKMKSEIRRRGTAAIKQRTENADAEARHIFREFIPAAMLNSCGFDFEYNHEIDGKTPDWIDVSRHSMMDGYTFERGGSSQFIDRVRSNVYAKCGTYSEIIKTGQFEFVVAVYIDCLSGTLLGECEEQRESFHCFFLDNECLSGLLFFSEDDLCRTTGQRYGFRWLAADGYFAELPNWGPGRLAGCNSRDVRGHK